MSILKKGLSAHSSLKYQLWLLYIAKEDILPLFIKEKTEYIVLMLENKISNFFREE